MTSLEVEFLGIRFRNPVIIASCPVTETLHGIVSCAEHQAGGVITKSIGSSDTRAKRQYGVRRFWYDRKYGIYGFSTTAREILAPAEGLELISKGRKSVKVPLIPSVAITESDIRETGPILNLCRSLDEGGACSLQIDCYYLPGQLFIEAGPLIRALTSEVSIPVLLKLNLGMDILAVCSLSRSLGVKGLCLLDSARVAVPIDPEMKGRALMGAVEGLSECSLSGAWLRPLSEYFTYRISGSLNMPLCSGGGLQNELHVAAMIMRGATTVQIASEVLVNGFDRITEIVTGLHNLLLRNGYSSVNELRGIANIGLPSPEPRIIPAKAVIDERRCSGCGSCLRIAMCDSIKAGKTVLQIQQETCEGCGLCVSICERKAIQLVEIQNH